MVRWLPTSPWVGLRCWHCCRPPRASRRCRSNRSVESRSAGGSAVTLVLDVVGHRVAVDIDSEEVAGHARVMLADLVARSDDGASETIHASGPDLAATLTSLMGTV